MVQNEQIQKLAKRMKVEPEMIVFADFLFLGYHEVEAYLMAYPNDESLSLSMQKRKRKSIICCSKFKEISDERRELFERTLSVPNDISEIELISSERVAKEILATAMYQPPGSKERADFYVKYYEVLRDALITIQESTDETDYIHFHFPAKCNECLFLIIYNKHQIFVIYWNCSLSGHIKTPSPRGHTYSLIKG